jgi:hypothetical protein
MDNVEFVNRVYKEWYWYMSWYNNGECDMLPGNKLGGKAWCDYRAGDELLQMALRTCASLSTKLGLAATAATGTITFS